MKKIPVIMLFVLLAAFCFAQESWLSANDLEAASLTSAKEIDGFTILATAEKGVKIEAMDDGREAEDGEIFTMRIKLNGSGALTYRAVSFKGKKGQKVIVYLNSSSKTDARVLQLADKDGTIIASITAPVDSDPAAPQPAGMGEAVLPSDGEFFLYSKSSGINLYQIIVE